MESPVADFIVGNHARLGDLDCLPVYAVPKEILVVTRAKAVVEKKKPTLLHVSVPGLESVTPEQLRELQREDQTCQPLNRLERNISDM